MGLEQVFENLEEIAQTSSTIDKINLLKEFLTDPLFKKVIKYALDQDKRYKIKKFPPYTPVCSALQKTTHIFALLDSMANKAGVTDIEKAKLINAASINKETYEVVKRICKKDLRCGVNARLVNKAIPGLIHLIPYMRCSTTKKLSNIKYPAIAQEKADGMFANLMINRRGQVRFLTRNGKIVYQLNVLKEYISRVANLVFANNMVFTGELLILKDGLVLPRKIGNGILNQAVQNKADPKDLRGIQIRIWDAIPLSDFYSGICTAPYSERLKWCRKFIRTLYSRNETEDPKIQLIRTIEVNSYEHAKDFYITIRKSGGEGIILKNYDMIWKNHTSPEQVKMKNTSEAELRIVGWKKGKKGTKYENALGALLCKTDDGKVEVAVGSGFSDAERESDWDTQINKIVTVEFESVIQNKNRDTFSLFLPRFKEIRKDRSDTDTLDDLLNR